MAEERPIWGIHMEMQHGTRPVTDGFVAIGWPRVGDLSKLPSKRESFKKAVAAAYPKTKPGAIPVVAGTLFKFANEMKKGDLVIYPSKPDRMVNLGIIQSEYRFNATLDSEFPNRLQVKWSRHIARAEFSQNALHEIGSAVTLFQVKNNAEEFIAAFEGKPLEGVDVDAVTAGTASANTEEITTDFVIKRLKSGLNPTEFEYFVAHLLERMGYHARVTQQSGDGGVDIIAHKDELGFEDPIIKVQCKQTLSKMGQPEVAQLHGHVEARQHGLFVTLGDYTPQARQFERAKHNLRLIDGEELVALIFNHYDRFEPRYQVLLPMKKVYIPSSISSNDVVD
ncbi:MAG: restriction endonuclease [Xanthobacteraceae bacterium]